MPYANPPANGQRGALSPRHRVGSWYPVMLVELVPSVAAGDRQIGHTVTLRVPDDLATWLKEAVARAGVSQGHLVREKLEQARAGKSSRSFMMLAGTVKGPKNLSSRKGFSRA